MSPGSSSTRLIFEFEGDDVRLLSQMPVDLDIHATPPPRVSARSARAAPPSTPGRYVEVRDAAKRVLHRRRLIDDPVQEGHEVFAPEGGHISRVAADRPTGAFTVVVPVLDAQDHVALLAVEASADPGPPGVLPPPPGEDATPRLRVREVARFDLDAQ